jgi:hypothetical protein
MKAQRRIKVITVLFLLITTLDGGGWLRHSPATLPSGKRHDIRCVGSWVGPHGQSGRVRKVLPPTGIPSPAG